jgi:hypothetical protein
MELPPALHKPIFAAPHPLQDLPPSIMTSASLPSRRMTVPFSGTDGFIKSAYYNSCPVDYDMHHTGALKSRLE